MLGALAVRTVHTPIVGARGPFLEAAYGGASAPLPLSLPSFFSSPGALSRPPVPCFRRSWRRSSRGVPARDSVAAMSAVGRLSPRKCHALLDALKGATPSTDAG